MRNTTKPGFREDIHALRGFSAIIVCLYHLDAPWLSNGYLGVDIFFVISGYVIAQVISSERRNWSFNTYRDFLIKRIKRIWPAMVTTVAVSMLVASLVIPQGKFNNIAFAAILGLSNVALILERMDYFHANTLLNPYLHTWSLGVEVQAYLIMPLLMSRSLRGKRTGREKHASELKKLLAISTLASLLLYSLLGTLESPISAINFKDIGFYSMPSRFWEMGLGMLAYLNHKPYNSCVQRLAPIIKASMFAGILIILMLGTPTFLDSRMLLTACVYSFILLKPEETESNYIFKTPPVIWAGNRSYSIYLCHWPIICLTRWTFGLSTPTIALCIVLTFFLAEAMYCGIETRYRYAGNAKIADFLAFLISTPAIYIFFQVTQLNGVFSLEKLLNVPSHAKYEPECQGDERRFKSKTDVVKCLGAKSKKTKLLLIGDSHAGHFLPMLKSSTMKNRVDFRFINLATSNGLPNALWARRDIMQSTIAQVAISNLNPKDIIMISFYKEHLNEFRSFEEGDRIWNKRMIAAKSALRRLLAKLEERNIQVILLLDTPNSDINDMGICIAKIKAGWQPKDCTISKRSNMWTRVRQQLLFDSYGIDASQKKYIYKWDPSVYFEGNEKEYFLQTSNGVRVFDDANHISEKFSQSLSPQFDKLLRKILRNNHGMTFEQ